MAAAGSPTVKYNNAQTAIFFGKRYIVRVIAAR